jgi:subtilase family serine protease
MWNEYSFAGSDAFKSLKGVDVEIYPSFQEQFSIQDFRKSTVIAEVFDNVSGSSGVFDPAIQPMPGYQQKNLEDRWQGTGRRYPDVSVLAGGNTANGVDSSYLVMDLQDGKPVLVSGEGTSAGAPLLAGLLANITSGLRKKFGKDARIGLVNPYLYEQYNSKRGKDLLIDVPKGSNNASTYTIANSPDEWPGKYAGIAIDPDTNNEYLVPLNGTGPNGALDLNLSSTGKGFDAASGLGSINGQALFDGLMQVWSSI